MLFLPHSNLAALFWRFTSSFLHVVNPPWRCLDCWFRHSFVQLWEAGLELDCCSGWFFSSVNHHSPSAPFNVPELTGAVSAFNNVLNCATINVFATSDEFVSMWQRKTDTTYLHTKKEYRFWDTVKQDKLKYSVKLGICQLNTTY